MRDCFLLPIRGKPGLGQCPECDPEAKRPVRMRTRRPCKKYFRSLVEVKAENGLSRRLTNNPFQPRNEQQLTVVKGVCLRCPAYEWTKGGGCKSLVGGCRNAAYDRYHKMLGNAHSWCPVWLEKLGLIRTVEESQKRVDDFLASPATPPPPDLAGRGIVICGGGAKYLPGTYVLLRMLRHLGCALPIEVWHLGLEEMPVEWGARLAQYIGHGGAVRDAYRVADRLEAEGRIERASPAVPVAATLYGWESKLLALQWSRFAEVLLLDADQVPVRDPTFLFDAPEYRETGAVFWPGPTPKDIWYAVRRDTWQAFGIPADEYRDECEHETGQMLIDKRCHWDCLSLCNWYTQNGRNWFFKYQLGDKEIPRLSWRKLHHVFFLVPHGPYNDVPASLVHTDFQGGRLFQHRIAAKFVLPAAANQHSPPLIEAKFAQSVAGGLPSSFIGEELCLEWLRALEPQP